MKPRIEQWGVGFTFMDRLELIEQLCDLGPSRTGAPLVPLAVEPHSMRAIEIDILDAQISNFLHSGVGVVHQGQDGAIAQTGGRRRNRREQLINFVTLKVIGRWWRTARGGKPLSSR